MKRHTLRSVFLLFFGLFAPVFAYAVNPQDIDAANQVNNTTFTIKFVIGTASSVPIHIANPTTNVFWGFGAVTFPGCGPASGETYTCQGVTLTLPATSTSTEVSPTLPATVSWTGMNPPMGAINFTLNIGDGTFHRTYTIEFSQPLDAFFVLDKSGSMNAVTEGTTTRIAALKAAVNNFMGKLSNPAFAGSTDRVGLNFFDTSVTPPSFGAGLIPLTPAGATTIASAINPVAPSGSTAMGLGINDAKSKLTDATHTRDIIVFTDGEQNVAPLVNGNGQDVGGVNINPTYPAPTGSLRVFTIGIGSPSPTYLNTLKNLASANRGECLLTSNGASFTNSNGTPIGDINAVFTQTFINLLRDSSPQLVQYKSGSVTAGQKLMSFLLNKNVEDLVIEIQLNKHFEIPTLAQIIGSIRVEQEGRDVTNFAVPQWVGVFPDTYLLAFSFNNEKARANSFHSEGNWAVSSVANGPAQGLTYRIAVIADDHLLDYTCAQSLPKPTVGSTQHFSAKLSYLGKPLDGVKIIAYVYKPGDDIGDLMARNPLKVISPRQTQDRSAVGILKYQTLLLRDPAFVRALTPNENVVALIPKGNGLYEGDFSRLDVAGIYQILFHIRGSDTASGPIDRYEMQSMYVLPAPIDPGRSSIFKSIVDGQLVVTMRPVTTTGKFVGPAAADAFDVNAQSTKLANVIDNQDGSYTLTFRGDAKSVGTINLLNQKVFSGRFTDIQVMKPPVIVDPTGKPPVVVKPPVIVRPPVVRPPVVRPPVKRVP